VLLLTLTIVAVIPYGTVDMWWEAGFECAVFLITACWLFEGLLRGTWEIKRLSLLLPLLLITIYAFAQTIQWPMQFSPTTPHRSLSIDRYQTYLTARKMLALTLYFGLLLLHTSNSSRFRWLVRTIIAIGFGSALFAFARQLIQSPDSQTGFLLPFLFYGVGYGQFIYHNLFAYLMEMAFGLIVGVILGGGIKRDLVLIYAAVAVVVWAGLILAQSRGGALGFICESMFLVYVSLIWYSSRRSADADEDGALWLQRLKRSRLVRGAFILLMVIVLSAGIIWMGGEEFSARLGEGITTQPTVDQLTRTAAWRSTWQIIKQRPFTGTGFGTYFLAIPQYQIGAGRYKLEEAHNDYLDLAANGGLIAVVLALWLVVLVTKRTISAFASGDRYRRAAALGAASGILALLVNSVVDFGLQVTGIATIFLALVVICVADERVQSAKNGKTNSTRPLRVIDTNLQESRGF
jgi:O-antigen ligase